MSSSLLRMSSQPALRALSASALRSACCAAARRSTFAAWCSTLCSAWRSFATCCSTCSAFFSFATCCSTLWTAWTAWCCTACVWCAMCCAVSWRSDSRPSRPFTTTLATRRLLLKLGCGRIFGRRVTLCGLVSVVAWLPCWRSCLVTMRALRGASLALRGTKLRGCGGACRLGTSSTCSAAFFTTGCSTIVVLDGCDAVAVSASSWCPTL
mmetsp:Transcript_49328/g.127240  ORF Transcript_49328/g.127240 Transcript_49328/m.127240 type:complete len:210 (+) Transcript_49328:324-953(+)